MARIGQGGTSAFTPVADVGEAVSDEVMIALATGATTVSVNAGGKPSTGTPKDKRLKRNK